MTQTEYTNAIVNAMLSWLKGLVNWVLKLFNLSGGASPLRFLANNWLKLLIFFLIIGVAVDMLVWLVRWRPYWVWFRKKRVIINDKNFFSQERYIDDADDWDDANLRKKNPQVRQDWKDNEFVVPSKTAPRKRPVKKPPRKVNGHGRVQSLQVGKSAAPLHREHTDVFRDDLFNVNAKQKFSDKYEDEVFNVSNLPRPQRPSVRENPKNINRRPSK